MKNSILISDIFKLKRNEMSINIFLKNITRRKHNKIIIKSNAYSFRMLFYPYKKILLRNVQSFELIWFFFFIFGFINRTVYLVSVLNEMSCNFHNILCRIFISITFDEINVFGFVFPRFDFINATNSFYLMWSSFW